MSHDAVPSCGPASEHSVAVPGGTIYYRTEGSGPPLVLIGGGPSNADTLSTLAGQLATGRTVITYDRRGYSRSRLDDPSQTASIAVHADDVHPPGRVRRAPRTAPALTQLTCADATLTTPTIDLPRVPSHASPMVIRMKVLSSRSLAWLAAAVCFGALPVSTALAAQVPILAGPWGLHQRGYGHARPSTIYNGGDPTGLVRHIQWKTWGAAQAVGTGIAEYVGPHQIVAQGTQQAARIVLFQLGSCRGRRAYDAIEWYFPQHGQHFDPHQYINVCTGTYYPAG